MVTLDSGPARDRSLEDGGEGELRVSYARQQEDILLDRLFGDRATGTFVDVGANHPYLHSNTFFFYQRGWRGVNIEPLRRQCDLFAHVRPEDRTLAVAASDREGTLPFYEIPVNSELSTLSAGEAARIRAEGHEVREVEVPVRTLGSLVAEHDIPPPDFLTIDAERCEAQVLRGTPLDSWRPGALVIESFADDSLRDWEGALLAQGYLFAHFNGVNRFYLRDDLRDRIDRLRTPPVDFLDRYEPYAVVSLRKQAWALAARHAEAAEYARRLEGRVAELETAHAATDDYARRLEAQVAAPAGGALVSRLRGRLRGR